MNKKLFFISFTALILFALFRYDLGSGILPFQIPLSVEKNCPPALISCIAPSPNMYYLPKINTGLVIIAVTAWLCAVVLELKKNQINIKGIIGRTSILLIIFIIGVIFNLRLSFF